MLLIWGLYARRIGLVPAIEAVKLKQKTLTHSPQTKRPRVLGGHARRSRPLARHQPRGPSIGQRPPAGRSMGTKAWADYSGVSRTYPN